MKRYVVLLLILTCSAPAMAGKKTYSYFVDGDPADATGTGATPGIVLMGGSTDVDAAFQWMCARSGGGDFLVIRAAGTDAYNPYIRGLCPGLDSVATLIIPSRDAANQQAVLDLINEAEAIWIAGGDQGKYVEFWQGSPVEGAVNAAITSRPVGGTSAGLNVLSQFVYSALASKGATSSQALDDPFNRYMTFTRDFLTVPVLAGTIADPHFAARDRMGRELGFLCRVYTYGWSPRPRAIAVDEQTALLIDSNGSATLVGSGSAYFLEAPGEPQVCAARTPLTYRNVAVYRVAAGAGGSFDLWAWVGVGGTGYTVSAEAGVLSSTQPGGAIY